MVSYCFPFQKQVIDVKRLIGRKFDDETVQEDIKSWPFPVINVAGEPHIRVKHKGEITSFSPFRISSLVLTKMKQIAETKLMQTVTVREDSSDVKGLRML